jgi:hypothetical protein
MPEIIEQTGNPAAETQTQPQPSAAVAGFTDMLDASLRDNPSIVKFGGDPNKLAQSYLSLQSLMGQGRVAIPKDETDAEAWGMYDKAFGVPDKDDGYELTAPDGTDLSGFKKLMRENHISPKTAQKLLDAHLGDFQQLNDTIEQQRNAEKSAAEAELKKEWGLKYAENMQTANQTLKKLSATKEDYEHFLGVIGNDARFIRLLSSIGEKIGEGSLGGLEGQVSGFTRTPAEAGQELQRILSDPNDAYFAGVRNQRNNPVWCKEHNQTFVTEAERKARVEYVQSLMQMAG